MLFIADVKDTESSTKELRLTEVIYLIEENVVSLLALKNSKSTQKHIPEHRN